MTTWLALEDYADSERTIRAGSLLDDTVVPVAALAGSGLAAVVYNSGTMAAALAGYLAQRASKPSTFQADGDLTAMLLAAGAIGGGGGGGVVTVTASAPLASSGGPNPNISIAPGVAPGDLLSWNGVAWVRVPAPATPVTSVGATAPITSSGGATPTIALAAGVAPGDLLSWNGAAWVRIPAPTPVTSVGATAPITSSGGATPTIALTAGTAVGDLLVWDGAAWVATAATPESYQGFQTNALADYYGVQAADGGTVAPGADNFLFLAMVVPFTQRSGATANFIAQNAGAAGGAARGWRLHWGGANIEGTCYVTGPAAVQAVSGTSSYSSSFGKLGKMHAVALRVYQSGGSTVVEVWLNGARIATASGAATVLPANNAADRMRLGSGQLFGSEDTLGGGCYGAGYFAGTVTDNQLRTMMGDALRTLRVPSTVAWTNRWQGPDVSAAPALWVPDDGPASLERVASPTGSTAFFAPA